MFRSVCIFVGLLGLGFVLLAPTAGWGDIYRYVDSQGRVHFTDNPTVGSYRLYLKERAAKTPVREIVRRYAGQFRLEEALVKAVIKVESDYDPDAVSRKGAVGIMQLMPQTAKELRVVDPLDPEENIRGGARYLRMMLDRFGTVDLALAAYNAGPTAVARHGGIPPYPETRTYVERVKKYLRHYRQNKDTIL